MVSCRMKKSIGKKYAIQTVPTLLSTKGTRKTPGNRPRRHFKQFKGYSVADATQENTEKPAKQQNNPKQHSSRMRGEGGVMRRSLNNPSLIERSPETLPITIESYQKGLLFIP